jgi:WD40 repeat protein
MTQFVSVARSVADGSGTVVLSMCNHAFVDLADNLLASLPSGTLAHTLMVALDDASLQHFAATSSVACVLAPRSSACVYDASAAAFGSVAFISICHLKAWLVAQLLQAGLHVLWTDTDIVWLSDARTQLDALRARPASAWRHRVSEIARLAPLLHDRARFARAGDPLDLIFQADDDGLCAGFFFARSSARTLAFMDSVLRYLNPLVCDQMSMRRFIDDEFLGAQLNVGVLDRLDFPNGTVFFDLRAPQRQSVRPCIVHNNCVIGHDSKVRRFEQCGLWLVARAARRASLRELPPVALEWSAMRGHGELVGALCALRDGSLLSGSHDKTLRTWSLASQRCTHIGYVHMRGGVWSLAVASDGTAYTGSHDRTAAAWRFVDGAWAQVATFAGHTRPVNAICLADDGVLVTASDDGTLRSWSRLDGGKLKVFVGHTAPVTAVAVAGGAVFSASMDGSVRAWQLSTARCMQMYDGHVGWVRCVAVDKTRLFSGGVDKTVRVFDQRSGDCLHELAFDDAIAALLLRSDDGALIVVCDRGGVFAVRLAAAATREQLRAGQEAGVVVTCASLLGENALALGLSDGSIQIARSLASAAASAAPSAPTVSDGPRQRP